MVARVRVPIEASTHPRDANRQHLLLCLAHWNARTILGLPGPLPSEEGFAKLKIKVVVHEAEEGGYWAEVPGIPGCASEGDTMEELLQNLREAIEGCLSVDVAEPKPDVNGRVLEIAI